MPGPSVSGPGALSRRTDRGTAQKISTLPDAQYGEAATYKDLQNQAPLAQTPGPPPAPRAGASGGGGAGGQQIVPLTAPTARPDEPVTSGAASGPGPGPAALGLGAGPMGGQYQNTRQIIETMAQAHPDNPAIQTLMSKIRSGF